MNTVSISQLLGLYACNDGVERFVDLFEDGEAEVTLDNCKRVCYADLSWFAVVVLKDPHRFLDLCESGYLPGADTGSTYFTLWDEYKELDSIKEVASIEDSDNESPSEPFARSRALQDRWVAHLDRCRDACALALFTVLQEEYSNGIPAAIPAATN